MELHEIESLPAGAVAISWDEFEAILEERELDRIEEERLEGFKQMIGF